MENYQATGKNTHYFIIKQKLLFRPTITINNFTGFNYTTIKDSQPFINLVLLSENDANDFINQVSCISPQLILYFDF